MLDSYWAGPLPNIYSSTGGLEVGILGAVQVSTGSGSVSLCYLEHQTQSLGLSIPESGLAWDLERSEIGMMAYMCLIYSCGGHHLVFGSTALYYAFQC